MTILPRKVTEMSFPRWFSVLKTVALSLSVFPFSSLTSPSAHAWGEYLSVSPGSHLVSTAMSDEGYPFQCTAGWAVHDSFGEPGLVTAGHCRLDKSNNSAFQRTILGDILIGYYTNWEMAQGVDDAAYIDLTNPRMILVPKLDGRKIARVISAEEVKKSRPELCKFGSRSGLSCGTITSVTDTEVSFRATDEPGDSGAPVYVYQSDGTVAAVGILFGHTDDAKGRVIHVSLLAPLLEKWKLTLAYSVSG